MLGRLSVRYWAFVASLLTGFLVIGGAIEMYAAFQENVRRIAAVQKDEALTVAGRVEQELRSIEHWLENSASLPWRESLLGPQEARQEFHRLMSIVPRIHAISGFGSGGKLIVSVSGINPDFVAPGPIPIVTDEKRPERVYGPIAYKRNSEPFTTLSLPVGVTNGMFTRIEALINLKFVSDDLGLIVPPGSARRAFIIDRVGNVIADSSDPTLALKRLNVRQLEHIRPLIQAGEDARHGVAGLAGRDPSGRSLVASGVAMHTVPWLVVVEEPREHAWSDAWSTVWRTAVLVAIGLATAVLVSFILARRLSRPIVQLRRGTQRIAQGDLAARINVRTGDEIEALADDFNRMADQLQEYTTGLERKVDEKTAKLQEAMRARALFLAAASHDLRQPLYAISLFADALTDEPMTKGGSDTLEKQRRAIAALRTLFDNLLDLSRFDAGEVRPVYRNVSLREILLPIAQEYEMVCASKNLKCRWEILDVWVNTDAELLRRVVRNLLSNAVRYTTTGEIQMVALVDGSKVTLQVIDTGIGIAPEDQGRIFDEFVQLDNPARERDKGVGLGLSIVKRISDLIGAGLRLDSRLGSGTTVSLDLPVVAAEAVAPTQVPVDDFSDMAGLTVWVVEDDPAVQSGLAKLFDSWRMRHRIVSSRKELMRLRESGESLPDAVILDDMLGSGDGGLEIAQWLRTFIPEERIVLVTGNVNDERTRQLEASGLVVLRKPLAASDLAQWLRDATAAAKAS